MALYDYSHGGHPWFGLLCLMAYCLVMYVGCLVILWWQQRKRRRYARNLPSTTKSS